MNTKLFVFFIGVAIILLLRIAFRPNSVQEGHSPLFDTLQMSPYEISSDGYQSINDNESIIAANKSKTTIDFDTCVDGVDGTWDWSDCSNGCGTGQQTKVFNMASSTQLGSCIVPFCAEAYTKGLKKLQDSNATQAEIDNYIAENKCIRRCTGTVDCTDANSTNTWINLTDSWTRMNGSLKQVDIDGNTVCGVNSNDDVYCRDDLTSGSWRKLRGKLKQVSVSNGKMYGVNAGNAIYYKPNTDETSSWTRINGSLKQVNIDGDVACGVNSNDDIYCRDDLTSGSWRKLRGKLKQVSVSNGKMYGVNAGNGVYYKPNTDETSGWTRINGSLNQVDLDDDTVCGTNSNGKVFCKDNLTGDDWKELPGNLKQVSVSNNNLYAVNSGDAIYYKLS
jgi:hypothetical protein